jgi:hypothetical protein
MKHIIVLSLAVALQVTCAGTACAQGKVEERVYRIRVEDREAGRYTQKITTYGEGTIDIESKADVKVKVAILTFQYAYRGHERWKEGKLQYLASSSNDDGKTHTLMVTAEGGQLKVKEGGKERPMNGDAWSTSYWTLPPADRRTQPLVLVDADSGEEHRVQMQVVGKQTLQVGTQAVACTHYRVTGTIQADLWFDDRDRLVKRESLRKGRKAIVELQAVTVQ